MTKPPVDFGIITIREDELDAVLQRFSDKLEPITARRRYNLRRVELPGGDAYTVAVMRCTEQGNGEAQAAARDLLEDLDPSWLLVVGIAGSVPAYEFTLGDVVVSTRVLDFSVEAVLKDQSREYALSGGPVAWDAATFATNLPAMADELAGWNAPDAIGMERPPVVLDPGRFYGDEAWKADVLAKLEHQFKDKLPRPPRFTTGSLASSDRLVKDAELLAVWLKIARQVLAVEMEAAGVYRAARSRSKETPFLAVRGLSDVVGYKRDPAWTSYACRTAAAFAHGLLRTRPIEPRVSKVSPSHSATSVAPFVPSLPRPEHFFGRDALAERLRDVLLGAPPPRALLQGPAGIGKTTLALAVLHRPEVAERFGARRFFVRLEAARDADAITGAIASSMGRLPQGDPLADACAALGRERSVVVLDNLETPWEQEREGTEKLLGKLAAVPGLSLIATLRGAKRPEGLAWSETMALRPLDAANAVELFTALASEHRYHAALASLLTPLGGVPLAIKLFGRAAEGNDLDNLAEEWNQRRTALLVEEGAHPDRLTSWAVSVDLSFQSKRMTDDARRLAGLLAMLPDGIAQGDLSALLPGAGPSAARVLAQVGLASFEDGRLRMLAPIREYAAMAYPAAPEDLNWAMEWYGELARSLGPKAGNTGGAEAIARLGPETANLETMIQRGLLGQEVPLWIDTALALVNFGILLGKPFLRLLLRAQEAARAIKDRRREAGCAFGLGRLALFPISTFAQAEEMYTHALSIFHDLGDTLGQANCLAGLGDIATRRWHHDVAKMRNEQARALYHEAGNVQGEVNCVVQLANIALRESDYESARANLQQALPFYRDIGDILGQANCLDGLGNISIRRSDYEAARVEFEQALPLYRLTGVVQGEAECILKLGDILFERSEYEAARANYEQALLLYRQIGNMGGEVDCIIELGDIAFQHSDYGVARAKYERALLLSRNMESSFREAQCLLKLGDVAFRRSDHAAAHTSYEHAYARFRGIGEGLSEATCLVALGNLALARMKHDEAQEHYNAALQLFLRMGAIGGKADCFKGLGDLALARTKHDEALEQYESALQIFRRIGTVLGEAECLKGLGDLALALAQYDEAQEKYAAALQLFRRIGTVHGEADCLHGLGNVDLLRSQLNEAEQHLDAALPLYRRIEDPRGETNVLLKLQEIAQARTKHDAAEKRFANGATPAPQTAADTIAELRIKNLRTLADVRLRLDGLTVLLGDNGTGKSSLIEVCEILRRAAGPAFSEEIFSVHGGPPALLRAGTTELTLGVRIQGGGEPIDYELSLDDSGQISKEALVLPGRWVIDRKSRHAADILGLAADGSEITWKDEKVDSRRLVLTSFGARRPPHPALARVIATLERIEVHLPFEVTPSWLARSTQRPSALRSPAVTQPIDRLAKLGTNLANAYAALKNDFGEEHWHDTMAYVRLGLGDQIESVNVRPDPGGGSIALWLKYAALDQQLPASGLSDGTLAYLALVALYRLGAHASLLAFDEPELHLHPELLMRALDFFEAMARDRPVLLATHSDRLLDGLSEPSSAAVLCELDEERRTRLVRPDKEALERWLERYRGLGDVRSAGHQASVMTRAEAP